MNEDMKQDNVPKREQYWSELDDSGKIDRLRTVLKNEMMNIARQGRNSDTNSRNFREHKHVDGTIVTLLRESFGGFGVATGSIGCGKLGDGDPEKGEVYF